MSYKVLICAILLMCIALSAGQGRRGRRGRGRGRGRARLQGAFGGLQDCQQVFNATAINNQFCTSYVDYCQDVIRTPQFPDVVQCGACIFTWITACGQPQPANRRRG